MFRCQYGAFLLLFVLAFAKGRVPFEKACTPNPVYVYGDHTGWWDADRSSYELDVDHNGSEGVTVSIKDAGSRRKDHHAPIKALLLQAFDEHGHVIGDWQVRSGPLYEVSCPADPSSPANVLVSNEIPPDVYASAVWQPPMVEVSTVTIRGYVVDRANRVHRTAPHRLTERYQWPPKNYPSLEECGSTKGCYLVPPNCALPQCIYAVTWRGFGDSVWFELMGVADGWVGVGFSGDKSMRDSEFAICRRMDDNTVRAVFTTIDPNAVSADLSGPDLSSNYHSVRGTYADNRIYCMFKRTKTPAAHRGIGGGVNLAHPHYLIATYGNRGDIVGDALNVGKRGNVPIVSSSRVDFNKEAHFPYSGLTGSWLAKVHMCLMIIAWVLLASIAILTSRYYRPVWTSDWRRNGKHAWLSVHQPLIIAVAVLTVIAFIFILFEVNWTWVNYGRHFWHSFLGIIVVILSVINAAIVFCVPKRQGRAYCLWFWLHWFVSSLAHCLAIPVIFLGMDLPRLDLWDWCSWLLLAWCIFHIITDLILEIHYCMAYRRSYERFEEVDSKGRSFDRVSQRYPPGYQWKPFCLGLYIVVTLCVVLALIIAVIVYD